MLTSAYVSGRLGDEFGNNFRYVEVESPLIGTGGGRRTDLIPVYNPLGKSATFFRAKKGSFVIVKGRIERDLEHGLYIHCEIEEIVDFKREEKE